MSYSAKQWSVTIRVIDALAVAVIIFVSYLTWSFYQQFGKIRVPVGYSTLLYVILFIVIRGLAKIEKKKSEAAEPQIDSQTSAK